MINIKVYRYLPNNELIKMINGDIENIGSFYENNTLSNTHNYKPDKKYLHFFKNIKDLDRIRRIKVKTDNMYLAEFEIPLITLIKHSGKGAYMPQGYDTDFDTVTEFAIPTKEFQPNFLKNFVADPNFNITPEDAIKFLKESNQIKNNTRSR